MSLSFIHNGLSSHLICLKDYGHFFDKTFYFPDLIEPEFMNYKATIIACRSDNNLLKLHKKWFLSYLNEGGFLIIMGEMRADIIDPFYSFHPTPTYFNWFIQKNPDSGCRINSKDHNLVKYLTISEMEWHYHGYYSAQKENKSIVRLYKPHSDEMIGDILFDDKTRFNGRLMVSTLDPHFHHGAHFMIPATRFLNGFYPWLRDEINGKTLFC